MKTSIKTYSKNTKMTVTLKDVFSQKNILRALRESTEDQRKVLKWASLDPTKIN